MDRYDKAIAYLSQFLGEEFKIRLHQAWNLPWKKLGGVLFLVAAEDGADCRFGCLTQIRYSSKAFRAATPELTAAIHADERLPECVENITREHLPLFAEWQRKIDELLPDRVHEF